MRKSSNSVDWFLILQVGQAGGDVNNQQYRKIHIVLHHLDDDVNELYSAATFYLDELQSQSLSEFAIEYRCFMNEFSQMPKVDRPKTALDAILKCNKSFEPSIFRLLQVQQFELLTYFSYTHSNTLCISIDFMCAPSNHGHIRAQFLDTEAFKDTFEVDNDG